MSTQRNCFTCGKLDSNFHCEHCPQIYYCSVECQAQDWKDGLHQYICAGVKRGHESFDYNFDDDDESQDSTRMRPQYDVPAARYLTERQRQQLQNPNFLRAWVSNTRLDQIFTYVYNADRGFYGALNESNYFWFLVNLKQISELYDATFDYRQAAAERARTMFM